MARWHLPPVSALRFEQCPDMVEGDVYKDRPGCVTCGGLRWCNKKRSRAEVKRLRKKWMEDNCMPINLGPAKKPKRAKPKPVSKPDKKLVASKMTMEMCKQVKRLHGRYGMTYRAIEKHLGIRESGGMTAKRASMRVKGKWAK